ncbi:MAG: aldo/keto reductase [Bryobacteraceae bacterium]
MKRRSFIQTSAAATSTIALHSFPHHLFASPTKKNAHDRIKLGPMKVEMSRMAIGTGTNGGGGSSNQTKKMGVAGLSDLFKSAYDSGLNFWDAADQYGSHLHLRHALKSVPRDKVVILSKTHASTEAEMKADLDRFRRELNSDYIDILLLHCMLDGKWNEKKAGAMNYLSEAREKGIIKTHGVSCHTLEALKTAAATDWVQVDLARINPAGIAMDASPDVVVPILREMKAKGKGVIGMKILGAGKLRNRADEALQFALSLDCVDVFTIGPESCGDEGSHHQDPGRKCSRLEEETYEEFFQNSALSRCRVGSECGLDGERRQRKGICPSTSNDGGDGSHAAPAGKLGTKPSAPWTSTTAGAAVDGKPNPGAKEATVTGEIVDFSCYLQIGKHGEKHRSCAQKCLNNGAPIGLLTKDGTVYMLMEEEHDPRRDGQTNFRETAVSHAGHIVEVTGTSWNHSAGYKALYVHGYLKK